MWSNPVGKYKGIFFSSVREGMSLYFSISSVKNWTILTLPLSQRWHNSHPDSSIYLLLSNQILNFVTMFSSIMKWYSPMMVALTRRVTILICERLEYVQRPYQCMKSSVSIHIFLKWILVLVFCKKLDSLNISSPGSKLEFRRIPSYLVLTRYLKCVLKFPIQFI